MENSADFKCYLYQRQNWFCPMASNHQIMKVIELVYPEWQKYEEKYLESINNKI